VNSGLRVGLCRRARGGHGGDHGCKASGGHGPRVRAGNGRWLMAGHGGGHGRRVRGGYGPRVRGKGKVALGVRQGVVMGVRQVVMHPGLGGRWCRARGSVLKFLMVIGSNVLGICLRRLRLNFVAGRSDAPQSVETPLEVFPPPVNRHFIP
jgi:hypothetical protein